MDVREKLVELQSIITCPNVICNFCEHFKNKDACEKHKKEVIADNMIAQGVTVQEWIAASEPPKENGYYLCVILFSAVGNKKEYRRKILFWEDNVWIEKPNSFRIEKPLYWTTMLEMPQPSKGE